MTKFENNLREILSELNTHKRSRDELNEIYVNDRLTSSLNAYYEDITKTIEYLSRRNARTMMKKIAKEVSDV